MTCRADIHGGLSNFEALGPSDAAGADGSPGSTRLAPTTQALRLLAQTNVRLLWEA